MSEDLIKYKDKTDFPFAGVKNSRWLLAFLLSYGSFIFASMSPTNPVFNYIFFIVAAFASLFVLDRKWYKKIIGPLRAKDILTILGVLFLLFATIIALSGLLVNFEMEENPIIDMIKPDNYIEIAAVSIIQLFVEEIYFVIPFLFCYHKLKNTNKTLGLILAWIISSLIFGALHLETYNFNIGQSLILIGSVRLVLSLAYIIRKNLLTSYIVHLLYDFIIIAAVIMTRGMV